MSFYRTYRPQTLTDLVGQEHVKQTFLGALAKDMLAHAYLFTGPRGTGKTSTARIIARAILCAAPADDGEPCNSCDLCTAAIAGRLVDLIEIDAASNRGIDEIRDLKEKISFAPSRAKAKVYIIDEVHMLTKEAFNALLKTLEEPPAHAYFILATTEIHKVPETIISRCQRFDFHRIEVAAIVGLLGTVAEQESITADADALELIAKQSAGGLRDALGMLEQIGSGGEVTLTTVAQSLGLTRPQAVEDFVHALLFGQVDTALAAITSLVGDGVNLMQFNTAVLARFRELMLAKIAENKLAEAKGIVEILASFSRAGEDLKHAIIPQLPLEIAAIEVCGKDITAAQVVALPTVAAPAMPDPAPMPTESTPVCVPAEPAPVPVRSTPDELTIAIAQMALAKISTDIQKPATRMSLREAAVLQAAGTQIVLGVSSDFHLSKLDTAEAKGAIAEAFSALLGVHISVAIERAEVEIASAAPAPVISPLAGQKKVDLAQAAEDMFADGGSF